MNAREGPQRNLSIPPSYDVWALLCEIQRLFLHSGFRRFVEYHFSLRLMASLRSC